MLGKKLYYIGIGLAVFFGLTIYIFFTLFDTQIPDYPDKDTQLVLLSIMAAFLGFLTPFAVKKFIAAQRSRHHRGSTSRPGNNRGPRRGWTEQEKEQVRNRQHGKCNKCRRIPPRWHYDHKDGDRSNNSMSNCQGLCPNCHDVKTHEED